MSPRTQRLQIGLHRSHLGHILGVSRELLGLGPQSGTTVLSRRSQNGIPNHGRPALTLQPELIQSTRDLLVGTHGDDS